MKKGVLIGFILGGIVFIGIGAYAALRLSASEVSYNGTTVENELNNLHLSKTSNNYSLEEQKIGTWLNGKSLYQKTYVTVVPTTSSDGVSVSSSTPLNLSIVDEYVGFEGYIKNANGSIGLLNVTETSNSSQAARVLTFINFEDNTIRISNSIQRYSGRTVYVTIRYTKTTD